MEKIYRAQVKLLLEVLPRVAREQAFALHGGTAINLFVRDMPRLSVDIDLTYLPLEDWNTSMDNINAALKRIGSDIEKHLKGTKVIPLEKEAKLLVSNSSATIKIEVSKIGRGTYAAPELRVLCEKAQIEYNTFCEIAVVPLGQLYGGKICAALDRQHPRDLFDVKYLLANEGISAEVKTGFIFCLLGAKRPLSEMLNPNFIDQQSAFEKQFAGMTAEKFSYEEYEDIKAQLVRELASALDETDRNFLIAFKNVEPIWEKYPFGDFPSIKRKLQLLQGLKDNNAEKHARSLQLLMETLGRK